MSQRQCKRYRKAIKKLEKKQEQFLCLVNSLENRPPIWRILSHIKWLKELDGFVNEK